jgi:FlaG/FlaF family flagellin (archaellin)
VWYLRKLNVWLRHKKALSPIFATVLLASIIIIFGTAAYYYSSNLTTTATNNYSSTLSNSQQSTSERISFENVVYSSSPNSSLKVYIINCGSANGIQIGSVFLYYTSNYTLVGQPIQGNARNSVGNHIFPLYKIDSGAPIQSNSLNRGNEGYFIVPLSGLLQSGTPYTIHVITQSGSAFDYDFTP